MSAVGVVGIVELQIGSAAGWLLLWPSRRVPKQALPGNAPYATDAGSSRELRESA